MVTIKLFITYDNIQETIIINNISGTSNMENEIVINEDDYNQEKEPGPNYLLDNQEHINKVIHL